MAKVRSRRAAGAMVTEKNSVSVPRSFRARRTQFVDAFGRLRREELDRDFGVFHSLFRVNEGSPARTGTGNSQRRQCPGNQAVEACRTPPTRNRRCATVEQRAGELEEQGVDDDDEAERQQRYRQG